MFVFEGAKNMLFRRPVSSSHLRDLERRGALLMGDEAAAVGARGVSMSALRPAQT